MRSLLDLPNRGVLPATGPYGVCTKLPTYIALHSTSPDQEVTTDHTNPLVRKLQQQKQKELLNATRTPGKGSGTSRKRKCATPEVKSAADKSERRMSLPTAAKATPKRAAAAAAGAGAVDYTQKTFSSAQLSRMQKKELQQILRCYGATVSGKKQELAERVTQAQSRRKDRVIIIDEDDNTPAPAPASQGRSVAAEQEGASEQEEDMTDVDDNEDDDEDADQPMHEAQGNSELEADDDGFTRESI